MADLDLIPADYRKTLRVRGYTRRLAGAAALALLVMGATRVVLDRGIQHAEDEFKMRRAAAAQAQSQSLRLERLEEQRRFFDTRLKLLSGLRGGIAARELFVYLDRALDERIAFREWSFLRAGEWVEEPKELVSTGYFLVVPEDAEPGDERAWRMDTHLEVRGSASDHRSLARFVRRLVEQPEVEKAHVVSTHMKPGSGRVVFEVAVVVRSGGGA